MPGRGECGGEGELGTQKRLFECPHANVVAALGQVLMTEKQEVPSSEDDNRSGCYAEGKGGVDGMIGNGTPVCG